MSSLVEVNPFPLGDPLPEGGRRGRRVAPRNQSPGAGLAQSLAAPADDDRRRRRRLGACSSARRRGTRACRKSTSRRSLPQILDEQIQASQSATLPLHPGRPHSVDVRAGRRRRGPGRRRPGDVSRRRQPRRLSQERTRGERRRQRRHHQHLDRNPQRGRRGPDRQLRRRRLHQEVRRAARDRAPPKCSRSSATRRRRDARAGRPPRSARRIPPAASRAGRAGGRRQRRDDPLRGLVATAQRDRDRAAAGQGALHQRQENVRHAEPAAVPAGNGGRRAAGACATWSWSGRSSSSSRRSSPSGRNGAKAIRASSCSRSRSTN